MEPSPTSRLIEEQRASIALLNVENDALQKDQQELKSSIDEIADVNLAVHNDVCELKSDLETASSKVRELKSHISKQETKYRMLQTRHDSVNRHLLDIEAVVRMLRNEVKQRLKERAREITYLHREIDTLKVHVKEVSRDRDFLQAVLEQFQFDVDPDEVEEMHKKEREILQREVRQKRNFCLEMQMNIQHVAADCDKWKRVAEDLQAQCAEADGAKKVFDGAGTNLRVQMQKHREPTMRYQHYAASA